MSTNFDPTFHPTTCLKMHLGYYWKLLKLGNIISQKIYYFHTHTGSKICFQFKILQVRNILTL
jgi:hypothetical protein